MEKNPNSNRSKRRAKRNFNGSRPNRRAQRRLMWATALYERAVASSRDANAYTKPGAMKRW